MCAQKLSFDYAHTLHTVGPVKIYAQNYLQAPAE